MKLNDVYTKPLKDVVEGLKFNRWYDVYAEDIQDEARMEIRNLIDELE